MKKILFVASALSAVVGFANLASAADMAPAGYDWSGVYIGLNAGVAWSNSEVDGRINCSDDGSNFCATDFAPIANDLRHNVDDSGAVFSGGAMIGANWQIDSFVLGVEADVNYANFGDSNTRDLSAIAQDAFGDDTINASSHAEFDANWWGTVRGRMGFAVDNVLFYGTGGLAWGTIDASARIDACWDVGCTESASIRGSESDTNIGWTVGAGMEWGWDSWTFGAEYLYVDLGSSDFDHRGDLADLNAILPADVELSGHSDVDYQFSVVRATAKWKF